MTGPRAVLWLCAVWPAGCTDAKDREDVTVRWSLESRGTCADFGADTARVTLGGQEGDQFEAPCSEFQITVSLPIGSTVQVEVELLGDGTPVTTRLSSPEFSVAPEGVDVTFSFEREDFLMQSDFPFNVAYTGALDCAASAVTAQRIILRDADDELVEGKQVCWHPGLPDEACVPADGSPAPCRERKDEQVIADLDWGTYRLQFQSEAPGNCFLDNDSIEIDFSTRVRQFVLSPTGSPCD